VTEMTLKEMVKQLDLAVLTGNDALGREVSGGYASDMLSDVLTHAGNGYVWITMQIHPNILAVASSKDLSGIIIVNGRKPEMETLKKAEQKQIPILMSPLSTYTVAGRLYELGVK
jgi:predicted transcriptional regulator